MNKKVALLVFIFGFTVFLSGCFNKQDNQKVIQNDPVVNDNVNKTVPEVKKPTPQDYQVAVKNIFTADWQGKDIASLKKQLLELKTPGDYLDFHLNLAIALELIEQGQLNADQAKIEEGLEKINTLQEQNSWFIR